MQHLDEHTIAFYAMGAEVSSPEREAIEAHLRECHGCRGQVEELRGIDQHVADILDSAESLADRPAEALVTFPRAIKNRPDVSPGRSMPRRPTRTALFTALVRRYPVVAGASGLVLAFLAFLSINTIADLARTVEQPLFVRMNGLGTALEVYGKETKLFDVPVVAAPPAVTDYERLLQMCTGIADLDGDGDKEVITGAPYQEGEKKISNTLRIFSSKGESLSTRSFGMPVRYREEDYSGSFSILGLVVTSGAGAGEKEVLVGLNSDRSPYCLVRLDNKGRNLGEYWHFGWLAGFATIHLEGSDREYVLLAGVNDVEYRANKTFPALAILDPIRIEGSTESDCSRGFGFPASDAQVYYVKAGNVNPGLLSGVKVERSAFGLYVKTRADSSFVLSQGFTVPSEFPNVFYTFDKHVNLQSVWMSDAPRLALMDRYLAKNSPAGFDEFVRDLANKVQYWDGSQWSSEPTKIVRPLP